MRKALTNFKWAFTDELQHMIVEDGRVVERGPSAATLPPDAEDLGGKRLLPGFIDAHCHVLPTGLDLKKLHLGGCASQEAVLEAVRARLPETEPGQWLLAVHYDQTRFGDGLHVTRDSLDQITATVPILLRHVNGHAGIANSAALAAARIADDEPDPPGGSFARDAAGRMNGLLLEMAHEQVSQAAPTPSMREMVEAILLAGKHMASLGISAASDMMTGRFHLLEELEAYHRAAQMGCPVRLRLYLQWGEVFGPRAPSVPLIQERISLMEPDGCKVAGVKIFADGAIGSATAAIYGRFLGHGTPGPVVSRRGKSAAAFAPEEIETDGQLIYSPEKLKNMVRIAHDAGYQVAIHSIGDYSTDLVMDAFQAVDEPKRHRIEHAMILSDAQIERLTKIGCSCTMQPEFLMRFGHSYLRQLGPERMARLKRARSVLDAGIPLSFSSDRPIVAGNPLDGVRTAVRRPEGFDPAEQVSREEAVLAYTVAAARANGDGGKMGELVPGQLADYQVIDDDAWQSLQLG